MCDGVTPPCPNFSGRFAKPSLKLEHEWLITYCCFTWMQLITHAPTPMFCFRKKVPCIFWFGMQFELFFISIQFGNVICFPSHILQDFKIMGLGMGNSIRLPLQWRHNEGGGVSNHRRLDCLLNSLFRRRSKKTSKPRVTGLCEGNSPVTGEFPAQRTSNAENVSIWWRHDEAETNGRHFPDDVFKYIFFNENVWISINLKISPKFVPKRRIGSDNGLASTRRQAIIWTNDV